MSRWYPRGFNGHSVDADPLFRWFVIVHDGVDVGTVWLEREAGSPDEVRLGIMIGKCELLGKGIGRRAIEQALLATQSVWPITKVRLNVRRDNTRAIACYTACGFRAVGEGVKTSGDGARIKFITMENSR